MAKKKKRIYAMEDEPGSSSLLKVRMTLVKYANSWRSLLKVTTIKAKSWRSLLKVTVTYVNNWSFILRAQVVMILLLQGVVCYVPYICFAHQLFYRICIS